MIFTTSNYLTYTSLFYIFKLCQTFRPHSVVIISGKYRIGNTVAIYNRETKECTNTNVTKEMTQGNEC